MDRGIGRVLEQLESSGLTDDTLVLFTSDNGPQFTGSGDTDSTRFNCGYRGAKLLVYEGGIRLPAIVRWPAGLAGHREVDELVHFTDWLPTLLAAAGVEAPADLHLDGVNVLPLLQGEPGEVPETRFWQWNRYEPVAQCNAAMRDGSWKLVRPAISEAMEVAPDDLTMDVRLKYAPDALDRIRVAPLPDRELSAAPPAQLFHLASDPGEEHDLASTEPARVSRMEAALAIWFEEVEADRLRTA
jgi:arylsulfatase A